MSKTILITRPADEHGALAEALHGIGMRSIHEPLTDIVLRHTERMAIQQALLQEPDAVLLTSRHGAQALALLTDIRDISLLCIGEATADKALSLGFSRVSQCGGDARAMLDYIQSSYDPGSRFVYASAVHIRQPLDDWLERAGMHAQRVAVYEAIAAEYLSDTLLEQLRRRQIDAVTFLSIRSAAIFKTLLHKADMPSVAAQLDAFCLSQAIADSLIPQEWHNIYVAREPTLASLTKCVDNAFRL